MLIIDTGSSDNTIEVARLCGIEPHIEHDLRNTHRFIEPYVGTDTWIFGVDGDEIYDPAGLAVIRRQIMAGEYDHACQVQGWYLHATSISGNMVTGYPGPPSHTPTKLYNMKNISHWKQDGKHILFQCRPRINNGVKVRAHLDTWEDTPFRCVHTRFMQRSTAENPKTLGARLHGEDLLGFGSVKDRGGNNNRNDRLCYRRGNKITLEASWLLRED